ncbi:unnamed protein product [Protopolystoma xenopodis]|uniref:Uncharacterized protein n=1 Tax=Protopolystoma xenopodis TaxID=117903 RepID=A0A3S5C544_9PLAT|nr:unnamed protein product [Protopolystoma xenopodis]
MRPSSRSGNCKQSPGLESVGKRCSQWTKEDESVTSTRVWPTDLVSASAAKREAIFTTIQLVLEETPPDYPELTM